MWSFGNNWASLFYSLCKILHLIFHFVFDMELASFPSSYPNNISSQHSIQQPKPELLSLFLGPPLIHLFIPSGPKKQKKKTYLKKKNRKNIANQFINSGKIPLFFYSWRSKFSVFFSGSIFSLSCHTFSQRPLPLESKNFALEFLLLLGLIWLSPTGLFLAWEKIQFQIDPFLLTLEGKSLTLPNPGELKTRL